MKQHKVPAVCWLLKAYCVGMLLLQSSITIFFARVLLDPAAHIKDEVAYQQNPDAAVAMTVFFCVVLSLIFSAPIPFLLATLFWPRRPSAWKVGLIGLVAGFFTSCGWVGAVPLIVFWFKPEVKAFYALKPISKSSPVEHSVSANR